MYKMICKVIKLNSAPVNVREKDKEWNVIVDTVNSQFQHDAIDGKFCQCTTDQKSSADAELEESRFGRVNALCLTDLSTV